MYDWDLDLISFSTVGSINSDVKSYESISSVYVLSQWEKPRLSSKLKAPERLTQRDELGHGDKMARISSCLLGIRLQSYAISPCLFLFLKPVLTDVIRNATRPSSFFLHYSTSPLLEGPDKSMIISRERFDIQSSPLLASQISTKSLLPLIEAMRVFD
jgi:hypothetical protein